ncbi:hypothetical protein IWQ60_002009 [Tieghemiomyces parasiticus]|uniref:Propionyl-CoA carboxylase alpha chain, mitochondrial n=1 Tax=Tieghemiomyces parasiticus TaxID=78921 RepID=A0A9W8AJQ4_9FUNG|nr:hypothetical protein IWQ60_002009 [Tieghemiomyces parasiticus]
MLRSLASFSCEGSLYCRRGCLATTRALHTTPLYQTEQYFDKLLVANRGEIACRVMRTARKLGIRTVAVYSDADVNSPHVRLADEAVHIGPAPTSQSYLNVDRILDVVATTGAQAVHPGYGFLSENPVFVSALQNAGVVFIGPGPGAIAAMGDKVQSKRIAIQAGVTTIPGFDGVVRDSAQALAVARAIGYPVMIKASAGGGGKGMRVARTDRELREGFKLAATESQSSFGDGRLLIEKFIERSRHIEVQVLADTQGHILYLPERECSVQRRNQKLIEETPSTHLDEPTRRAMGQQAVALARGVGYVSAGTVEFLVDADRNFYFLEMNTRLQVEHPITEYVTGLDLVEEMIRVAAGYPLRLTQAAVPRRGWAIEARVYAEDPATYLSSTGTLHRYQEPILAAAKLPGAVRCDAGVVEGSEISIHYDSLLSKLCAHGQDRTEAISTLCQALDRYVIRGVTHNIPLLRDVLNRTDFRSGKLSTDFLARHYPHGFRGHVLNATSWFELAATAAVVHATQEIRNSTLTASASATGKRFIPPCTTWQVVIRWSASSKRIEDDVSYDNDSPPASTCARVQLIQGHVTFGCPNAFTVTLGDGPARRVTLNWAIESPIIEMTYRPAHDSSPDTEAAMETTPTNTVPDIGAATLQYLGPSPLGFSLQHLGTPWDLQVLLPLQARLICHMKQRVPRDLGTVVQSPMPGRVISVNVMGGETVSKGEELVVVEAMKMQNVLRAPMAGKVKAVHVKAGDIVAAQAAIIELE